MAENNSKTFIIGIVIFVLLVIAGFAFFAKKDVPADQTAMEATVPAPEGAQNIEVTPTAPAPAPTPTPAPADEVTPTAPSPAYNVEATPAPENSPELAPTPTPADETTPTE